MTVQMTCKCGNQLRAPEENVGRQIQCPACGASMTVPDAASVHSNVPAPPPPPPSAGFSFQRTLVGLVTALVVIGLALGAVYWIWAPPDMLAELLPNRQEKDPSFGKDKEPANKNLRPANRSIGGGGGGPAEPAKAPEKREAKKSEPEKDRSEKAKAAATGDSSADAVPPEKVRISLSKEPAKDAKDLDGLEFEWTMLSSVRRSEIKTPDNVKLPAKEEASNLVGPVVFKLTLRLDVDHSLDDKTLDKDGKASPKPGARHVRQTIKLHKKLDVPGEGGKQDGDANSATPPGNTIVLNKNQFLGDSFTLKEKPEPVRKEGQLVEVKQGPWQDVVKVLLKDERMVDVPQTLPLLEVGGKTTSLEVTK